jgi:thiol-disulfide isomerase/thioredoxin
MKNNYLLPVGLVLLVVGVVAAYVMMGKDTAMMDKKNDVAVAESMEKPEKAMEKSDEMMVKPGETMEKPIDTMETADAMMEKGGSYVPFSPQAFSSAATTRRVLFFYASWCPTCKPADADFSQNAAQLPADVTVIRVNYNDPDTDQAEKDLAKKYGVTYQHTYVQIDAQGNEVAKWNGGKLAELVAKLK